MTFEKVRDIIASTLGCDESKISREARLAEDLDADSLAAAELAMALEEELSITIEDDDLKNLKTVGDIIDYLAAHA